MDVVVQCPEVTKVVVMDMKDIPEEDIGHVVGTFWNIRNALNQITNISLLCKYLSCKLNYIY